MNFMFKKVWKSEEVKQNCFSSDIYITMLDNDEMWFIAPGTMNAMLISDCSLLDC